MAIVTRVHIVAQLEHLIFIVLGADRRVTKPHLISLVIVVHFMHANCDPGR